jgi:hypothetical protein
MNAKPQRIGDVLRNTPLLQNLLQQRQHEAELLEVVRAQLPLGMQAHCLDVRRRERCLTVFLDAPAWLTRLRFVAADLAAALTAYQIDEVRGRIQLVTPVPPDPLPILPPPAPLSAAAAAHLRAAAAATDDLEIQALFLLLARHHTAAAVESERS